MGGSGTGGWELLARQVKQSQRQLQAMAFKRAAMRAAAKDMRLKGKSAAFITETEAQFPCFHYCMDCGYLSHEFFPVCPACGESSLVDLTNNDNAKFVHELDVQRRKKQPSGLRTIFGFTYVLFVAGIVAFLVHLQSQPHFTFGICLSSIILAIVFSFSAYSLAKNHLAKFIRLFRPLRRTRWRLPLASQELKNLTFNEERGIVSAPTGQMTSPFFGSPCVAYRTKVFLRASDSSSHREILLDECEGIDFQVGDVLVRGRNALVDIPLSEVPEEIIEGKKRMIERHFRERGLEIYDGDLSFYEACIKVGDDVRVQTSKHESLSVISSTNDRCWRGKKGPYR